MKQSKIIVIVGIIIFILFLVGAGIGYQKMKENFVEEEKQEITQKTYKKAKDFTIYDEQVNKKTLQDFAGRPIVINTWTTWCRLL